jgi:hypothetical protein
MKYGMQTQNREASAVLFSNLTSGAIFEVQSGIKISDFSILWTAETVLPNYTIVSVFDAYSVALDEKAIDISIRDSFGKPHPQNFQNLL